jgi:hypothetical protein
MILRGKPERVDRDFSSKTNTTQALKKARQEALIS